MPTDIHQTGSTTMFSRYANGVRADERWTTTFTHADGVGAKRVKRKQYAYEDAVTSLSAPCSIRFVIQTSNAVNARKP